MRLKIIIYFLSITLSCCAQKPNLEIPLKDIKPNYTIEKVIAPLDNPWGMTWLPDGSFLITEKKGKLLLVSNGKTNQIKNLPPIYNRGQGGLLDVVLHPNFENNNWIYFSYAAPNPNGNGGNTAIARAKLIGYELQNLEVLYQAIPFTRKGQHFGSRLLFDNQGYLYFSIGDRGNRDENPQDITKDGGKIYRINDDGSIPESNPFYTSKTAKKAIFSYGHRNPQGLTLHPETGAIWIHEHGPKGGDEINIIEKGKNYGWPLITYGLNYSGTIITENTSAPNMEQPIYYWTPSIAPCGMDFITGSIYPDWNNKLLVGSLKFNYVELISFEKTKIISRFKIAEDIGRVRNAKLGPDGYIYIAVEGQGIFKLIPKS